MELTSTERLNTLTECGFEIYQIEASKYVVIDNGRFGFCSDEDPFIVDDDGLREIYETYVTTQ